MIKRSSCIQCTIILYAITCNTKGTVHVDAAALRMNQYVLLIPTDGELKHVRVVPQTDAKKCAKGTPEETDFLNLCFTYDHAGEENSDHFCVTVS